MKYICTFLFITLSLPAISQLNMNAGYSLSAPQQQLADNIKPLHSISGWEDINESLKPVQQSGS